MSPGTAAIERGINEEPKGHGFRRRRLRRARRRSTERRGAVDRHERVHRRVPWSTRRVDRSRAGRRLGHGHRYRHRLPGNRVVLRAGRGRVGRHDAERLRRVRRPGSTRLGTRRQGRLRPVGAGRQRAGHALRDGRARLRRERRSVLGQRGQLHGDRVVLVLARLGLRGREPHALRPARPRRQGHVGGGTCAAQPARKRADRAAESLRIIAADAPEAPAARRTARSDRPRAGRRPG